MRCLALLLAFAAAAPSWCALLFLDELNGGGACQACTFTAGNKLTNPTGDLVKVAQLQAANGPLDNAAMLLAGSMRGAGLNDVSMMIMSASMTAGSPINVVLVGHGAPGVLQLGGTDLLAAASKAAFVQANKGKINMLTLFGCCVAAGGGPDFLQMLANDLMATVKAYAGAIGVAKGENGVMDGFYVQGGNGALQTYNAIPEPGAFMLAGGGLILALAFARKTQTPQQ